MGREENEFSSEDPWVLGCLSSLQTCLIGLWKKVLNVRRGVTPETDGRDVICTASYLIHKQWGKVLSSSKRARRVVTFTKVMRVETKLP